MNSTTRPFYFTVFCLIFIVLAVGCSATPEEKKAAYYNNGIAYTHSGEHLSAIIEFLNAIKIDSKFADAHYQLGLAYLKTNRPGEALQELEHAARLDPNNTKAMIKAAEIYAVAGESDKSQEMIEKIFKTDKDFPDAHALFAQIKLTQGDLTTARQAIHKALSFNPDEARYHIINAQILMASDNSMEDAQRALKKGVELNPSTLNLKMAIGFYLSSEMDNETRSYIMSLLKQAEDAHELYIDMAVFYAKLGDLEKTEKYILAAAEKKPHLPELQIYLGNFYMQTGVFDKAEKAFIRAIENAENASGDATDEKAILADFYFKLDSYIPAEELANSIVQEKPQHPLGNFIKAKLLVRSQKNTEALSIIDKLIKDHPRWGEVYYQKGLAHLNKGEIRLSYNAAELALRYAPNDPEAVTFMAHHFLLQGDFNKAKDTATSALQMMPGNLRAGIILGRSMLFNGETAEAVKLFENMTQYTPENIEVLSNKGIAYIKDNRIEEGMDTLEKILKLNPGFTPAMATIARIYLEQGKTDRAISAVKHQLEYAPENPNYLIMLAELIINVKSHPDAANEALILLEKAREIAPEIPQSYALSAQILFRHGKTDEAITKYNAMIQRAPNSIEGHMGLGNILDQSGDKAGARRSYARVLEIAPNFAPAANNLAWLKATGTPPDLGEALRLALVAKAAHPEDPYISDTLGYVYYLRGSYRLALTQFTQAVEQRPDIPTFRYHLAIALNADGQTEKAKKELKHAMQLEGVFPEQKEAGALLAALEKE